MRTGNIMTLSNPQNLPKAPNLKPGTESSFKDIFSDKISAKDSNSRKDLIRDDKKRETSAKSVNYDSRDQKELDEKQEKRIRRRKLEELKALLSAEEMKELENPEELQVLLQKISELGEEIQLILGELLEQSGLNEALTEKVEALKDLDISLESLLGEGSKTEEAKTEEAKTLESLRKLMEGLQEITEKIAAKGEEPKELEKLLKAQEEMKALVEEGLKKATMMKEGLGKNPSKNVEAMPVKSEEQSKEKKAQEKPTSEVTMQKEKSASEVKTEQETSGLEKNPDKNIKEKDAALMKDNSNKEKNTGKEEKSSKVSLSLETKEEQPLERSFLFSQDKVENFEKLSAMIQKSSTGFEQNLSQMIEEMTEKISIMKNGEASQIKMQLVPNNLGKLVIQLSTDENVLSARVYADTPKVKEMIENQLQDLKEALIDKGLTVESLEVFVGQEQDRALYQKHGPMMMTGQNRSSQISFAEMEAMEEAALKTNPYVEKYQYNRLV